MGSPERPFAPRPWPRRAPHESPLAGRRVLVLDPDGRSTAAVGRVLAGAGCVLRTTSGGDKLRALLDGAGWDALLVPARHAHELGDLAGRRGRPALLCLLPDADDEALASAGGWADAALPQDARPERWLVELGRALERRGLEDENQRLRESLAERYALGSVVTRDPRMRAVLRTAESIADSRASVLLLGESGTGKTMLARAIHQRSTRAEGPFVVVNCGSLPPNLLESELFGHVRGAFTGAVKDRAGRFEQADGGTIFLDEVNSAPLDLQVKLLRVLQERTFERVGDGRTVEVDVRVLTASNRDLEAAIREGSFREDLYYRIHVVRLELPPLRERPGDVALLAEHFLLRYAAEYQKPVRRLDPETLSALVAHPWPGNVRQLENALERAVLLARADVLLPEDLGAEVLAAGHPPAPPGEVVDLQLGLEHLGALPPLREALAGPERRIILRALELNGGNRTRTAEMLDVNRSTLFNKMKKYGLMNLTFGPR